MSAPVFSVVIPAYRAAATITVALDSLRCQDLTESFEVIVVDSGSLSCAPQVRAACPQARLVRSPERLRPAAARNAGVRAAHGEHIAFLPADCAASPQWLSERLRLHREGYDAVGGSILNGRRRHPIASAEYLLEYSALLPVEALLPRQQIPHALSFHASVFDRFGEYPEDVETGEDTLFNRRCIVSGMTVGFAPKASLAHLGSTALRPMWSHAAAHGRGLMDCVIDHRLESITGGLEQSSGAALLRMLVLYPSRGWLAKLERLIRFAPGHLPAFLALSPLISFGSMATGFGAWSEWRAIRSKVTASRRGQPGRLGGFRRRMSRMGEPDHKVYMRHSRYEPHFKGRRH
jgi:glycosyltransferase involved in cell wall biosynthesis